MQFHNVFAVAVGNSPGKFNRITSRDWPPPVVHTNQPTAPISPPRQQEKKKTFKPADSLTQITEKAGIDCSNSVKDNSRQSTQIRLSHHSSSSNVAAALNFFLVKDKFATTGQYRKLIYLPANRFLSDEYRVPSSVSPTVRTLPKSRPAPPPPLPAPAAFPDTNVYHPKENN